MPSRAICPTTTALAAAATLLLSGLALAPRAGASTLYACVKKHGGTARFVSARTTCRRSERKIAWNTRGVPGAAGAKGRNGSNGKNGAPGKNGTNGANGASGTNGRDGASAGLVAFKDTPSELPLTRQAVVTLPSLPAGNYIAMATVQAKDANPTQAVALHCFMAGDESSVELTANGGSGSLSLLGVAISPLAPSLALECDDSGTSGIEVSFARVAAIQVQTLGGTTG